MNQIGGRHHVTQPVPIPTALRREGADSLAIDWADGHHSIYTWKTLRNACPCATCHDEREKSGRAPGDPKPQPATLLPMYQAPPRPLVVTPVGRYALSFEWNDGHKSGIYSWDYLRRHCLCEECRR